VPIHTCIECTLKKFTISIIFPFPCSLYHPPSKTIYIYLSIYIYIYIYKYTNTQHTQFPFVFPPHSHWPLQELDRHSCLIISHHHHDFMSTFHKWVRTCNIWYFFKNSLSMMISSSIHFPINDMISFYLMAK
jgi:hypothetical protein